MLRNRLSRWPVAVPAAGLAFFALAAPACADVAVEGASFKPSAKSLTDGAKSNRQLVVPDNVTAVKVVARGTTCYGVAPRLAIRSGGKMLANVKITSKRASTYVVNTSVEPGKRLIGLQISNANPKSWCARSIRVDSLQLITAKVAGADPAAAQPEALDPSSLPIIVVPAADTPNVDQTEAGLGTPAKPKPNGTPVEAESLAIVPSSAGKVFDDGDASANKAQLLWNNGSIDLTTTSAISTVTVRTRGDQCAGAPKASVSVDGTKYGTVDVAWTSWGTYDVTLPSPLAAGSHKVSLAYANNATGSATCDRNLRVDWIGVNLAPSYLSVPVIPAPTPDPTPTPTTPVPTTPVPTTPVPTTPAPTTPAPTTPAPTTPAPTTPAPTTPAPTTPVPTTPLPTTPAPTTPGPVRPKLQWAPPALSSPTTLTLGTARETLTLSTSKDYIIKMPSKVKDGLNIVGGRNVVIVGGSLRLTNNTAMYIKGAVGTVHLEGLLIDNAGMPEGDGIDINAPQAIVQIQNTRIVNISGSSAGVHGDLVQTWGGVKELRIDRFTGTTGCQGFFLRPDLGPVGKITLTHIDLNYLPSTTGKTNEGGDLIWLTTNCQMTGAAMNQVYIGTPYPGLTSATSVWPKPWDKTCPSKVVGTSVTWPTLPVTGGITTGTPPSGPFVPAGTTGTGYTTPGYTA